LDAASSLSLAIAGQISTSHATVAGLASPSIYSSLNLGSSPPRPISY
jgi:hypothetical protein